MERRDNVMRQQRDKKRYALMMVMMILINLLSSCSTKGTPSDPKGEDLPSPGISSISLQEDPSYEAFFQEDAFSQISKYILEVYHPDRALYNYLFEAAMNMTDSVDISKFNLSNRVIMDTVESLYGQAGFQLYHLTLAKWSKDYKTISFDYNDKGQQVRENQLKFYAHMNHLLHNVAPSQYNEYQKFFALYDYIAKNSRYSDDMSDVSTYNPYSLLVKGMAICGGYAQLADYALNYVGIPSQYISNEAHAWNIVTLNGSRYHADFTWGAGYANNESFLRTALMDDKERMAGLERAGFGEFKIIEGYPRANPSIPKPITDSRYGWLKDIGSNYAIDIENNWIYYSDDKGIQRISFDGSQATTVINTPSYYLAVYNGSLYYVGEKPNELYQLTPGQQPILIDASTEIYEMFLLEGNLTYGNRMGGGFKRINLNEYDNSSFDMENSKRMRAASIPGHKTFSIVLEFPQAMETKALPRELIGLLSTEGEIIPLSMFWSEDGKTLTLRTQKLLMNEEQITLLIKPGLAATNGTKTADSYSYEINLQ